MIVQPHIARGIEALDRIGDKIQAQFAAVPVSPPDVRDLALAVTHLWKAPQAVLDYLRTGNPALRREASRLCWHAWSNPVSYGASFGMSIVVSLAAKAAARAVDGGSTYEWVLMSASAAVAARAGLLAGAGSRSVEAANRARAEFEASFRTPHLMAAE